MQYMQGMLHLCQQDTALCSRCRPAKWTSSRAARKIKVRGSLGARPFVFCSRQGMFVACLISVITKICSCPFSYHGSQISHFNFTSYSNFYTLTFFTTVFRNKASQLKHFLFAEFQASSAFFNSLSVVNNCDLFATEVLYFFVVHWIQCWPLHPTPGMKSRWGFLNRQSPSCKMSPQSGLTVSSVP